jgi:hypothetical protein
MILRLPRTDSSIDFPLEDHGFALKQRGKTEALTTAFEEIPNTDAMKLFRVGFVSRLAAVCQAMEDLPGAAETVDSVVEWADAMGRGERRVLVEEIGRSGLADGVSDAERCTGDDFDDETVGCAVTRWERLVNELG